MENEWMDRPPNTKKRDENRNTRHTQPIYASIFIRGRDKSYASIAIQPIIIFLSESSVNPICCGANRFYD